MQKYISFGMYQKNELGGHQMVGEARRGGDECYLAADADKVFSAAIASLTEQRREFSRGDIPDLDALEDALVAAGLISLMVT